MHRLILILLLFVTLIPSAFADNQAREAFIAADRGNWGTARRIAENSGDTALEKLVEWQFFLAPDSTASFQEITRFISTNPNWPDQKRLRVRAELALKDSRTSDADIVGWFGNDSPLTGVGKIALARALKRVDPGSKERIKELVRDGWRIGDFEEAQEKDILSDFGELFTERDHIERTSRLLWDQKITPAQRMFKKIPAGHVKLFEARISLIKNQKSSLLSVARVPSQFQKDAGLIYDRMQFRARRNDDAGVREMLLSAPKDVPYPEKWWRVRESQVRRAIDEKKYAIAEKLLASSGELSGSDRADAAWLSGWLKLEFLKEPKAAYEIFKSMHADVRYAASRARAAYWAGRAAETSGNKKEADKWFETASSFPTTFYGQLGAFKRYGGNPLQLPESPTVSSENRQRFKDNEMIRAVELCFKADARNVGNNLVTFLLENTDDAEEAAFIAGLASESGFIHLGVRGAKKANQKSMFLLDTGYPRPKLPETLDIETPLALAITRQESEFDSNAISPAGAKGLMQLMPGTAKETAKKMGKPYQAAKLFDDDYNVKLGSHYLSRLINAYDGSYIMAIAAYNAGPGNVRKWIKQFGTPGNNLESAINWIEKIPFPETRNYVQRVMENLQVYRSLDDERNDKRLLLAEDLVR